MAQQSSNGNRPKLSEKGLLTPDNCVVALIDDHHPQTLFGVSTFDRQSIINNTVALLLRLFILCTLDIGSASVETRVAMGMLALDNRLRIGGKTGSDSHSSVALARTAWISSDCRAPVLGRGNCTSEPGNGN